MVRLLTFAAVGLAWASTAFAQGVGLPSTAPTTYPASVDLTPNATGKPPQLLFNAVERSREPIAGYIPMTTWRGSTIPFVFGGWPRQTRVPAEGSLRIAARNFERFVALDFEEWPHDAMTIRIARRMIAIMREEGVQQVTWYNRVHPPIDAQGKLYPAHPNNFRAARGSPEWQDWLATGRLLSFDQPPGATEPMEEFGLDAACDMLCGDVYAHGVANQWVSEETLIAWDAEQIRRTVEYLREIDAKKPIVLFVMPHVLDEKNRGVEMSEKRMWAYWRALWATGAHVAVWCDMANAPYNAAQRRFFSVGRSVSREKLPADR